MNDPECLFQSFLDLFTFFQALLRFQNGKKEFWGIFIRKFRTSSRQPDGESMYPSKRKDGKLKVPLK